MTSCQLLQVSCDLLQKATWDNCLKAFLTVRLMVANDLLVIGAGSVGVRVARLWRARFPDAQITCATATTSKHASFGAEGFIPVLASELSASASRVVFCAPALMRLDSAEYMAAVAAGAALARERFVFTSSTSVYPDSQETIHENSTLNDSARARMLLACEREAFSRGNGVVLRLGGLYDLRLGAHTWWLTGDKDLVVPEGMANFVHYDDAAAAVERALIADARDVAGRAFVIVDGNPVSSRQILEAAMLHALYSDSVMPKLGGVGRFKRIDCSWSKTVLGWEPKWKSLAHFFSTDVKEAERVLLNTQG